MSELDESSQIQDEVSKLTVAELREELEARGLDVTGLKATLTDRLRRALAEEKKAQEEKELQMASSNGLVKLFVGQVPPQTTDEELRKHFTPYGEVKEVLVLKDRSSGAHRGCGFVSYATRSEAERAIEALNDKVKLPGAKREMIVRVAGARPDDDKKEYKLYVGMLSRKSSEDDIRKLFEPYGDVIEVYLMRNKDSTGQSKGAAFIKYSTRDEALRAIQALNGRHRDKDAPGMVQVRFAHTKLERVQHLTARSGFGVPLLPFQSLYPGAAFGAAPGTGAPTTQGFGFGLPSGQSPVSGSSDYNPPLNPYASFYNQQPVSQPAGTEIRGPTGANLFIYNIPDSYDDHDLASLFSNFGTVLSTKVQRDKSTGASKGFGFVSFDNPKSASAAIASMDGFMIGSKRLNVRVKKGDASVNGGGPSSSGYTPY